MKSKQKFFKFLEKRLKRTLKLIEPLKSGQVIVVDWYDTHAMEKMTRKELIECTNPTKTISVGFLCRITNDYIWISNEIGAENADGNVIEQIYIPSIINIDCLIQSVRYDWDLHLDDEETETE